MAGGEILFGIPGFAPLCRSRAVNVIMPDVKHCGGLMELVRIAAMAEADGIEVAPHNPSGPVSTAASVHVCAVLKNFRLLEFQWGEVDWRHEVVQPSEVFERGIDRRARATRFRHHAQRRRRARAPRVGGECWRWHWKAGESATSSC
jgi:galactonate dehydratase